MSEHADIATVRAFCASWSSGEVDRIVSFLSEDAVWENVPIGTVAGKAAIRARLERVFAAARDMEWIVHHIARSDAGAVLTERLDRFIVGDRQVALRLMGVFEVRAGVIGLWRDYFDLAQYQAQLGATRW